MSDIQGKSAVTAKASQQPDYDLVPEVRATTAAQMKALGDPIRLTILTLVLERAATTTELATALDRPRGTVDHHLKVLAKAGFVQVVRTRQVRAITERFWGRTARTIMFDAPGHEMSTTSGFIREALTETERMDHAALAADAAEVDRREHEPGFTTLRHARIPADRIREFTTRLEELSMEFITSERGGDTVYALLIAMYPSDRPVLPDPTDPTDQIEAP